MVLVGILAIASTSLASSFPSPHAAPPAPAASDRLTPALTPAISVSPGQGPIGATFVVTGSGFTPDSGANVSFQGTNLTPTACSAGSIQATLPFLTNSTGGFKCSFTVPTSPAGSEPVVGWDAATLQSSATVDFVVTTPSISVNPSQGPVGTPVAATGAGFSVSTALASFVFDSVTIPSSSCTSGSLVTNSSGDFSCTVPVPASTSGTVVTGNDVGGQSATTSFTVTTVTIVVAPVQGNVGSGFEVTATGFTPKGEATLTFGTGLLTPSGCLLGSGTFVGATIVTNASGGFTCTFKVPNDDAPGPYPVYGRDISSSDLSNTVTFTVNPPVITVTPTQGPVGSDVTVDGSGFFPSTALTSLVFDNVPITSCPTPGPTGDFSCEFAVPTGTSGTDVIATEAGGRTATATFVVTVPGIVVTPTQGPVGDLFTVTGTGFTVSSGSAVSFNGVDLTVSSSGCSVGTGSLATITTNDTGVFVCTFAVPSEVPGGYSIVGTDLFTTAQTNSVSFEVTPLALSVTPGRGPSGTSVTVSGSGFSVLTALVSLDFDNVPVSSCVHGSLSASASGSFSCALPVPSGTFGTTVVATDLGGGTASTSFVVTDLSITVSPGTGPVGTAFTVSGSGFNLASGANVSFAGTDLVPVSCSAGTFTGALVTTNASGAFACGFTVPSGLPGVYPVVSGNAETSNDSNAVEFTIPTPTLRLSPGEGTVGSPLSVAGTNFTLSAHTNVTFGGVTLAPSSCSEGTSEGTEVSITSSGGFTCAYSVPPLPAGPHAVTAKLGKQAYSAPYSIVPSIVVSPATGKVGTTVSVGGLGFDADAGYVVGWNNTATVCSGSTNSSGEFNCTFAVPQSGAGAKTITVSEGGYSGSQALSGTFTVSATPAPPSSSPFPWWKVAVAAAVVVLVLVTILLALRRTRSGARPGTFLGRPAGGLQPYAGPSPSLGTVPAVTGAGAEGVAAGVGAPSEPEPDIDELIARLERMSVQMFKKTPKELAAQASEGEVIEPPSAQ